jgi:hypothetical protein
MTTVCIAFYESYLSTKYSLPNYGHGIETFNTSNISHLFERAVGCALVRCHGIGKADPGGDELMLSAGRQVKRRGQVVLIVQVGTF